MSAVQSTGCRASALIFFAYGSDNRVRAHAIKIFFSGLSVPDGAVLEWTTASYTLPPILPSTQLEIGFEVQTLWNQGADDLCPVAGISGASTSLDLLLSDFRRLRAMSRMKACFRGPEPSGKCYLRHRAANGCNAMLQVATNPKDNRISKSRVREPAVHLLRDLISKLVFANCIGLREMSTEIEE